MRIGNKYDHQKGCRRVQKGAEGCRRVQKGAEGCRRVQKGAIYYKITERKVYIYVMVKI